ncbi:MAG: hypothetical protein K2X81_12480 [Candidatus Obscuribacterales bacterium]|nr:hypothetical protein [Candidatus Obscuribacterales bacterium]
MANHINLPMVKRIWAMILSLVLNYCVEVRGLFPSPTGLNDCHVYKDPDYDSIASRRNFLFSPAGLAAAIIILASVGLAVASTKTEGKLAGRLLLLSSFAVFSLGSTLILYMGATIPSSSSLLCEFLGASEIWVLTIAVSKWPVPFIVLIFLTIVFILVGMQMKIAGQF